MRCPSMGRTRPVLIATLTFLEWRVATREQLSADSTHSRTWWTVATPGSPHVGAKLGPHEGELRESYEGNKLRARGPERKTLVR